MRQRQRAGVASHADGQNGLVGKLGDLIRFDRLSVAAKKCRQMLAISVS